MARRTVILISVLLVCLILAGCTRAAPRPGPRQTAGPALPRQVEAVEVGGTPPGAPSAPTVLTGRSLAQLIWPATAGASSYCIYRNGTFVNSVTGALYYIDEGLVLGSSLQLRLSAANTAGESGKSLPVAAATAIWTKIICSSAIDFASGIALDGDGNFYVTGYTTGNLDGQTNAGLKDIFVTKYDQTGTKQWTSLLGTASDDAAGGIAVDASGNVYVTGYTNGSLAGQTNAGGADVFVAKYDGSGARIWVALLGTSADDAGNGIAADSSGNVYVTGIRGQPRRPDERRRGRRLHRQIR